MITATLPTPAFRSARPALRSSPNWEVINQPGQCVDVQAKLIPGKTNIVYFSAEWCPYCQKMAPRLQELVGRDSDYVVRKVDIGIFKSPVCEQYGITKVPSFRLYDGQGEMLAQGDAAREQLNQVLKP